MHIGEMFMEGKLIVKDNNWWIEFENGVKRRYYPTSFLGDLGYISIKGKKIDVEIDIFKKIAKTY